ncbi:uncharacterized protein LAJ45_00239 [Morchella importuna]|uniref:uncharacterized protein n=1 Tax=Morchella importuna TaxID=1174673 RepID=UPI001E8D7FC5|nr:uncharacterized protein LAJ45_00239 [Morchella importuna]KAH8155230.1 hypothetical protein LAJ45_00239 [Morchella importuna]
MIDNGGVPLFTFRGAVFLQPIARSGKHLAKKILRINLGTEKPETEGNGTSISLASSLRLAYQLAYALLWRCNQPTQPQSAVNKQLAGRLWQLSPCKKRLV